MLRLGQVVPPLEGSQATGTLRALCTRVCYIFATANCQAMFGIAGESPAIRRIPRQAKFQS
jgi:hypothetical protein